MIRTTKKTAHRQRQHLSFHTKCMLCLAPSLLGLLLFYILPYLRVLYYSLINNQFKQEFIGLQNYKAALQNEYFRLAFANSVKLILLAVPVLMVLAILVSLGLTFLLKRFKLIRVAFILPMLIPTASVVLVFRQVFGSIESELPLYLLFLWMLNSTLQ